jgi:hypothetical protein
MPQIRCDNCQQLGYSDTHKCPDDAEFMMQHIPFPCGCPMHFTKFGLEQMINAMDAVVPCTCVTDTNVPLPLICAATNRVYCAGCNRLLSMPTAPYVFPPAIAADASATMPCGQSFGPIFYWALTFFTVSLGGALISFAMGKDPIVGWVLTALAAIFLGIGVLERYE